MISIVTGTLNRLKFLPRLIENTVDCKNVNLTAPPLELVLVDGGSTDGSIEYIENLNHPNIKLIKVGKRSGYPHYMNLGIKAAKHEWICQWNDDVLMCNDWLEVQNAVGWDTSKPAPPIAILFNWKFGEVEDMEDPQWLQCSGMRDNGWIIINNAEYTYPQARGEQHNEVCMNYGIYSKAVFREHGLYNESYNYYCADAEMAMRAYHNDTKFRTDFDLKVCVLPAEKRAIMYGEDVARYGEFCQNKFYNDPNYLRAMNRLETKNKR